ncbi:hypothetical protein D3C76_1581750 [compost metagenome]
MRPRTLVYGRVDTELRVAGSLERAFANVLHIVAIDLSEVGTSEQGASIEGGGILISTAIRCRLGIPTTRGCGAYLLTNLRVHEIYLFVSDRCRAGGLRKIQRSRHTV